MATKPSKTRRSNHGNFSARVTAVHRKLPLDSSKCRTCRIQIRMYLGDTVPIRLELSDSWVAPQ
jgi:hypothetical protein